MTDEFICPYCGNSIHINTQYTLNGTHPNWHTVYTNPNIVYECDVCGEKHQEGYLNYPLQLKHDYSGITLSPIFLCKKCAKKAQNRS